MREIRVAIFEDNRNLREGLFNLLESSEGFTCVGAFAHCERVVDNIEETQPDVILMDIELPVINGIEAVKRIREKNTSLKILMETIFEDDEKIFQSICNGAQGYILKNTPPDVILKSIREIYEGGAPMNASIATQVLKMFASIPSPAGSNFNLSDREKEVLQLLVDGNSYKMVAAEMDISIDTVRSHIRNIYDKLHVNSKSEAVAKALKHKIV